MCPIFAKLWAHLTRSPASGALGQSVAFVRRLFLFGRVRVRSDDLLCDAAARRWPEGGGGLMAIDEHLRHMVEWHTSTHVSVHCNYSGVLSNSPGELYQVGYPSTIIHPGVCTHEYCCTYHPTLYSAQCTFPTYFQSRALKHSSA